MGKSSGPWELALEREQVGNISPAGFVCLIPGSPSLCCLWPYQTPNPTQPPDLGL